MQLLIPRRREESAPERAKRALEEASRLSAEEGRTPGWVIEEALVPRLRAVGLGLADLKVLERNNTNTGQHFIHFDQTPPSQEKTGGEGGGRGLVIAGLVIAVVGVIVAVLQLVVPLL